MGSIGFVGGDESQPSTTSGKKYKLPRTLLDGCVAVNDASVPRKLRSAIKKRGGESVTSTLPVSRKQHRVSNGVETLRKYVAKKSKLNMKQGRITKDEEEVAEALFALAGSFSDTIKANPPEQDDERSEANLVEDTGIRMLQEESRKIGSKVTIEAACHSSLLVDSKAQVVKFQSSGDVQQPELPSSKQPADLSASGVQSDLNLLPRPRVSTLDMTPSGERAIELQQATASGIQYDKNYYPMDDKYKGLFPSPSISATAPPTDLSSTNRLPAWFEKTRFAPQPRAIENSSTTEKYTQVAVESKQSWKRCTAHVYISRLIKVLQVSERNEGLLEKLTQVKTREAADLRPRVSIHSQMAGINSKNNGVSFNGFAQSATEKDSAETSALCSAKQGYDFLSLGTGVRGLDAREGVNRTGRSHENSEQFHMSYMQSQNHSPPMLFSLPQHGYSSIFHGNNSALAAQQVQIPQYISSTANGSFTSSTGQQMESQQQKWAPQLQTQYNSGGVISPHLPDWKNGRRDPPSMVNYAHALFPHLYQQFSSPQQQLMPVNSSSFPLSNVKRHHHHNNNHLPLGFERNGTAFYPENIPQLQLPCNQRL